MATVAVSKYNYALLQALPHAVAHCIHTSCMHSLQVATVFNCYEGQSRGCLCSRHQACMCADPPGGGCRPDACLCKADSPAKSWRQMLQKSWDSHMYQQTCNARNVRGLPMHTQVSNWRGGCSDAAPAVCCILHNDIRSPAAAHPEAYNLPDACHAAAWQQAMSAMTPS
jgi:hypothetical protein